MRFLAWRTGDAVTPASAADRRPSLDGLPRHAGEQELPMPRRARDVLLDILRDEGVTHVFGNPGSTEMPLMDALVDAPDIAYVLGLQEATAVAMADGWALASGQRRLRQPARDGRARQCDGRAGRLEGERDAARRHRRPAGHPPPDERAVAVGRPRRARCPGRQMGQGSAPRRGRRAGAAPRLRHRPHAAAGPVFLSLPMDVLDRR